MNRLGDKDSLIKYLEKSTVQVNGCWLYTGGSKRVSGHRAIRVDNKIIGVHRLSAYIFLGLDLNNNNQYANHKNECSSKVCWNPEHIYIGTHQQNIQDYIDKGHYNKLKTHCNKGHLLTVSTTSGKRQCRICKNEKSKIWHANKRKSK